MSTGIRASESGSSRPAPKAKKCKTCGELFVPMRPMQRVCPKVSCAVGFAKAKGEEREKRRRRKELAEGRKRLRTKRDYLRDAQAAFNAWVRERDRDLPCVSCGIHAVASPAFTGGGFDCGHYRSVGANPELRFEPLNVAKQCKRCNRQLSGNVVNFRRGLLERIGEEKLAWLEGPHEPKRYTVEQLVEITADCRRKVREMQRARQ